MKIRLLLAVVCAALLAPAFALGQEATPSPDPFVFDDPAMHYQAPPNAHLIGQMQHPTLDSLSQDPSVVAAWVIPNPNRNLAKVITIAMESYTGNLDGFDSTYENDLRSQDPATLIKSKQRVTLQNGMPALFLDVTQGAGFQTHKVYSYIWIDSQRAVVLSVTAALGGVDDTEAKQILAGATAVRYPDQNGP